ncbi:TPA: hypothetical protein DCR49_06095 [Candidatus Delongbacteria bacterium]|nr:MAG: hypothetical protein A2Y39_06705 [Candidatus Delongbacteria bacterium GWF2_40_14]HAQ61555.1 hypothetical protein [Candidatus Delongbacteria bacterium]
MKRTIIILLTAVTILISETLFEVKDASNNKVLDISTDGLRVLNLGDTLMVISPSAVKVNISDGTKALSRTFSVTTTSAKKGLANALEIGSDYTNMSSIDGKYTDFSPLNLFLGLNSGQNTVPNPNPFNAGDQTTWEGKFNIFVGNESGRDNVTGYFNLFVGDKAGQNNSTGPKNTFVGSQSGQANSAGGYNTFLGYNSGITSTGNYNTAVGADCGFNIGANYGNTLMGSHAGEYFTGDNNTFIGCYAGRNYATLRTGDGNVFIGSNSGTSCGSVSNKLYIANSSTNTPLIKGTFPNTDLVFTANNVSVVHPTSTSNGLYIQNSSGTNSWHLYQYSTYELGLFYNTNYRGEWDITSGAYSYISDLKLKKNLENITGITDKVMKLQPVRYNFINQKEGEKRYIGLVAQDVKELFPEFVNYNDEADTYTMDYAGLSVVAIQAIKEQQTEIDELKLQIKELRELIKK